MPARIQQLILGLGAKKQTTIGSAGSTFLRFKKLDTALTTPKPVFENDAAEIGKGHEFITQTFPSHYDVANRLEKYASAEFITWACLRPRQRQRHRFVRAVHVHHRADQSRHHARTAVLLAVRAGRRGRRQSGR